MKNENKLGDYEHFVKSCWSADELENLKVVTGFLQTLSSKDFNKLLSEVYSVLPKGN